MAEVAVEYSGVGHLTVAYVSRAMAYRDQEQQRQEEQASYDELSPNRHRDLSLLLGQALLKPLWPTVSSMFEPVWQQLAKIAYGTVWLLSRLSGPISR